MTLDSLPRFPRYNIAVTPEERLGAVARELVVKMISPEPNVPDYRDFTDALRPYVRRELLLARIETAMHFGTFLHIVELKKELGEVDAEIAALDSSGPEKS